MYLDIEYMQVRSKNYVSGKPKASHNLKQGSALQSAHVWNELRLLEAGLCNITCAELIPVYGPLLASTKKLIRACTYCNDVSSISSKCFIYY
jgi:hypothetical protein